jgi:AcrR family transcriptional regulator
MIYQTDETRHKIIQSAEALFLKKGFFGTQMKDVAAKVGVSRNTLYRYYRDKGDLGFAILEIVFTKLVLGLENALSRAKTAAPGNARELLVSVVLEMITHSDQETNICFMTEFDAYFSGDRIPEDFHTRISFPMTDAMLSSLDKILQDGMAEGSIRSDIPPQQVLNLLIYSIKNLHQEVLSRSAALLYAEEGGAQQLVSTLARVLMDGLKPQESS